MKKYLIYSIAIIACLVVGACKPSQQAEAEGGKGIGEQVKNTIVKLETSEGDIIIELDDEKAPITVANFIKYVDEGFYDGTIFHRVIPDFMIQGGGFTADMQQKKTHPNIKNEADNGLKNNRGTIAMARALSPDTASSQFFINLKDNDFLNFKQKNLEGWGYCVFGKVTSGMEVVDKIATVKTGTRQVHQDVPMRAITIKKASLENG